MQVSDSTSWAAKALNAECRIQASDITTTKVKGVDRPVLKPEVLQGELDTFREAHILRLRNVARALEDAAGKPVEEKEIAKAARSLQYLSTRAFVEHILREDPEFLGEEKGTEFLPYAEIYSVTRQTLPHCHGRTFWGSLFSLGYGSARQGIQKSGALTLWNLLSSGVERSDEYFVKDKFDDYYLKRKHLPNIENVDLPGICPSEQPIVLIHDGVTAHSNTKVQLNPGSVRPISFMEMCPVTRLDPTFIEEQFQAGSIEQRRDAFFEGNLVGVLDTCPDTR